MNKIGVIIGRFQVDEIHSGHTALLDYVAKNHENMLILLGVKPTPASKENPLDFRTRKSMLATFYPNAEIMPVVDMANDEAWSQQVDNLIYSIYGIKSATLYGGRDSFIPHYSGRHTTEQLNFGGNTNGTEIRERIAAKPLNDSNFRAGVIYAMANLNPQTFMCVDIAMVDFEKKQVLLGKKTHENGWRFPGGHVDKIDKNFELAARREMYEETKMTIEGKLKFIGDFDIDDWRVKDSNNRYHTALFLAPFSWGVPKGSDDLSEVAWWPLTENINIVPEHKVLLENLKKYLAENKHV